MSLIQKIKRLFPSLVAIRNRLYNYIAHYRFKNLPAEKVFTIIYKENHWGDAESNSGAGSNSKNTVTTVNIVNEVIEKFELKSILDIPCGDFNWMKNVNIVGINYLGADIVSDLIQKNKKFESDYIKFSNLNILESQVPKVDLIFTRDCLVHFSHADINQAISNVKKSGSKYWMTTTFIHHKNYDIVTGDWRPINLQAHPFNLPAPIYIQNENYTEDERYSDKSLAIWKIEALK